MQLRFGDPGKSQPAVRPFATLGGDRSESEEDEEALQRLEMELIKRGHASSYSIS